MMGIHSCIYWVHGERSLAVWSSGKENGEGESE